MKAGSIKVVKLTPQDVSSTPEGFERMYEKRNTGKRIRFRAPQPKLAPIENQSMQDRMESLNINET